MNRLPEIITPSVGRRAGASPALPFSPALPAAAQEMRSLHAELDAWRKSRDLSDVAFCKQFPLAGDRRTWASWREKEWDRSVGTWLPQYRQLRASLADYDRRQDEPETLVFDYVADWDSALKRLRSRRNEKRALWCEGGHGSGKTTLLNRLCAELGEERSALVRGKQSWRSLGVMLEDMLRAIGEDVPLRRRPESAARLQGRLSAALARKNGGDFVLAIDQSEKIHGPGMNVLCDLINDMHAAGNLVHFAGAALPGVWDTMTERYVAESSQLRRRFCDLVVVPAPDAAQCRMLVAQRVDPAALDSMSITADKVAVPVWELMARRSAGSGGRSFVADVRDALAAFRELTPAKVAAVIAGVVRKNGTLPGKLIL